jgi:phosphopantothenoylcysteine synthetase/decarboxylase
MNGPATPTRGVLYIVTCAAGPARDVHLLVGLAQQDGWHVCCIVTPNARDFVDVAKLEELTGHPVRSEYKKPWEPDVLPPPVALIVAPASFNTINKWAAGISDTLALGLITEAIGKGLPIVSIPAINAAQAKHPAFAQSIETLRQCGVHMLYGEGAYEVHEPGMGAGCIHLFPWQLALRKVSEAHDPSQ